ncbi:MAG: tRNA (adenosine(37)-N6)-threonylcarbamoyltransferase complex dimerization subunit type 1 TsaB [Flavobacteriaceae bacterium]|nr:tRNA (adenosine(37)-N6)-threonylcarbamoyltransferase complex dimerization subunit type 1 TsaB [Flavobacteriaceae bacterium]
MALILNLESSTRNCSVSISLNGEELVLCETATPDYQHAEKLHEFVLWAFEACDYQLQDLDAVAVGKGPGSYTGLRIGVAAAKGFCFSLGIPLIALNSLEIMANANLPECDLIIPMTDARRKEVYTAVFDKELNIISATEAKILDEKSFQEFDDKRIVFLGDGAEKAKTILNLSHATFLPEILPSAGDMHALSFKKFQQEKFEDIAYFEPLYLKDFVG